MCFICFPASAKPPCHVKMERGFLRTYAAWPLCSREVGQKSSPSCWSQPQSTWHAATDAEVVLGAVLPYLPAKSRDKLELGEQPWLRELWWCARLGRKFCLKALVPPLPSASPLCCYRTSVILDAVENIVHFLIFGEETVTVYTFMYQRVLWPTGFTGWWW